MNRIRSYRNALGTPVLRISRPIAACSRCRRAKIKCDGKLPACSACEKAGYAKSCASPIDKSVDGNEKSYVACLESRIRELEEKISLSISPASSPKIKDSTSPVNILEQENSLTQFTSVDGNAARRREVADVNKLVSDFGFLSINATTHDFEEAITSMTFARLILAAASNESLPDYGPFRLPSKSISRALADYYIENILILFPIFDQKILLDVLESIYQNDLQHVADSGYWMFYMTLAISSICQSRSKIDRFYKDAIICIRKALSFADRVLVPGCVSQVQALILFVQYSMLDPAHFDSWNLTGVACRAVIDLGFHQDPPKEEQIDKKILELRRTLFYCVYSLDRSISMVHARSFSFTDDSTSVAFPSAQIEEPVVDAFKDSRMEQSLLIFKLRKIQSSWYQELFQSKNSLSTNPSIYIQNMCQEMQKLAISIPEELPLCVKNYFDLELFYSFVYCLAPSSQIKAVPEWGKNLIFESSVKYIQKMIAIYQKTPMCTFITYHDALRVYFVGSQFVSALQEDRDFLLYFTTLLVFNLNDFKLSLKPPYIVEGNNSERALCCIVQIKEILKIFSHRWDDSKVLLSSFEAQIDCFTGILDERKKATRIALIDKLGRINSLLNTPRKTSSERKVSDDDSARKIILRFLNGKNTFLDPCNNMWSINTIILWKSVFKKDSIKNYQDVLFANFNKLNSIILYDENNLSEISTKPALNKCKQRYFESIPKINTSIMYINFYDCRMICQSFQATQSYKHISQILACIPLNTRDDSCKLKAHLYSLSFFGSKNNYTRGPLHFRDKITKSASLITQALNNSFRRTLYPIVSTYGSHEKFDNRKTTRYEKLNDSGRQSWRNKILQIFLFLLTLVLGITFCSYVCWTKYQWAIAFTEELEDALDEQYITQEHQNTQESIELSAINPS